jgi:hypothetical protein
VLCCSIRHIDQYFFFRRTIPLEVASPLFRSKCASRAFWGTSRALPVILSVDKLFDRPRNTPFEATSENQPRHRCGREAGNLRKDPRPHARRFRLSQEFTRSLVGPSRKEGTTVHGALSSALVLEGRATANGRKLPFAFNPQSIRKNCWDSR